MNIIIRKATVKDASGIADYLNESLKRGFNSYVSSKTILIAKHITKLRNHLSNKNLCIFVALDGSKVVGSADFKNRPNERTSHRAELGWAVHVDYARKGIATKLLKSLIIEARRRGLKRLEAEAAIANIGSVKLAKKLGFKIEGIKRKAFLLDDGRLLDTYIFGKLL